MRSSYVKLFLDKNLLDEMLDLRLNEEWSYGKLAEKYNTTKTTIRYQCLRAGLPEVIATVRIERRRRPGYYVEFLNRSLEIGREKRWNEYVQLYGPVYTLHHG